MQSGSAQSTRPSSSSSMPLLQISTPGVTQARLPKQPGSAQSTRPLQLSSTPSLQISGCPGAQPPLPPTPMPPKPPEPRPPNRRMPPNPPTPRPPNPLPPTPMPPKPPLPPLPAEAAVAADCRTRRCRRSPKPPLPPDPLPPDPLGEWPLRSLAGTSALAEQIRATAGHPAEAMATRKNHVDANRGERPIDCGDYAISSRSRQQFPGKRFLGAFWRGRAVGVITGTRDGRRSRNRRGWRGPASEAPCKSSSDRKNDHRSLNRSTIDSRDNLRSRAIHDRSDRRRNADQTPAKPRTDDTGPTTNRRPTTPIRYADDSVADKVALKQPRISFHDRHISFGPRGSKTGTITAPIFFPARSVGSFASSRFSRCGEAAGFHIRRPKCDSR